MKRGWIREASRRAENYKRVRKLATSEHTANGDMTIDFASRRRTPNHHPSNHPIILGGGVTVGVAARKRGIALRAVDDHRSADRLVGRKQRERHKGAAQVHRRARLAIGHVFPELPAFNFVLAQLVPAPTNGTSAKRRGNQTARALFKGACWTCRVDRAYT